jgi:hypothetical protein
MQTAGQDTENGGNCRPSNQLTQKNSCTVGNIIETEVAAYCFIQVQKTDKGWGVDVQTSLEILMFTSH